VDLLLVLFFLTFLKASAVDGISKQNHQLHVHEAIYGVTIIPGKL